jgi:adenosylcobinamide kinase / adenosylcobinamide-phosphate guanylyltransferase
LRPRVTFILGGAASGKSAFAEDFCVTSEKQRIYLATSQVLDTEMQAKIDDHVTQRGAGWITYESAFDLAPVLGQITPTQICLVDCVTMWLTNQLLAGGDLAVAQRDLMDAIDQCQGETVIVSNETGMGIVPENALARRFREEQGRLNIALAARADLVVQVVAGLPRVLKGQMP